MHAAGENVGGMLLSWHSDALSALKACLSLQETHKALFSKISTNIGNKNAAFGITTIGTYGGFEATF